MMKTRRVYSGANPDFVKGDSDKCPADCPRGFGGMPHRKMLKFRSSER